MGFRVVFCCNAPFLSEGGFRVWGSGFGFKGLGFRVLVENQMEKQMEHEMDTLGPFKGVYSATKGYYPNVFLDTGK